MNSSIRLRDALEEFATTLEDAGFRVHRPGDGWTFIGFARQVEGQWCSATVQASDFGNSRGWSWHMRIEPNLIDGSSMFFDHLSPGGAVPDGSPLTVETATTITRPRARNAVLRGVRENAGWPKWWTYQS